MSSSAQNTGTAGQETRESSLQANLRFGNIFYEVHLTGEIPYTGMTRVPPGTRVDELLRLEYEEWKFREIQALIPTDPELGPQEKLDDALGDILNSELDLRNIQILKRDGSVVHADLIGYRLGGQLSANPSLEQGDVVNIRKLSKDPFYVSVSGAVKSPLTIPYSSNDTAQRLLTIAGGRSSEAVMNEVLIYRLVTNEYTQDTPASSNQTGSDISKNPFMTYSLTDRELADFSLLPGDRVVIPVDQKKRRIYHVTIQGEVMRPGVYPIVEGETTLSEILIMAGGPTSKAMLHGIEITRHSDTELDNEVAEDRYRPLPMLFRVSDQYEESRAQLELEIQSENNIIYANLSGHSRGFTNETLTSNEIPLQHLDEITVPKDQKTIRVMGQIGVPGFYPFHPDLTVEDYIAQASGLSPAADSSRIYVIKAATRNWIPANQTSLASGDILFIDRQPLVSYRAAEDLELRKVDMELRRQSQETNDRRTSVQIGVSLVNATVSIITTYLLIRRQ